MSGIEAERLRAALAARGLRLRPEDEEGALRTADFLRGAAERVRRAAEGGLSGEAPS
jgi:hypothetical protein